MRIQRGAIPFALIFALLLLVAFGLRVYSLEADAPHHLSVSQGLTTDGANTVYAGRNKVLFGQWSPEITGFPAVEGSTNAMNWLSYSAFSMLGVGYWQGGYLAVVLGILTISVIASFARRHFGNFVALLSTIFLMFNYAFLVFNRIPVAYTLVGLVMALVLYAMSLGQKKPVLLVVAILLAVFGIMSVKIVMIASLPMIIVGTSDVLDTRFSLKERSNRRLIALIALLTLFGVIFVVFGPSGGLFLSRLSERTVNLKYGLNENIRFLVASIMEFGIYSAFFVRMMPLFILSFGYVIYRCAEFVSRKNREIPYAETLTLMYLLGFVVMLLLSNQQPARHLILLIPPMSLTSAIVIDRILRLDRIGTARNLGYLFPIVVFLGLAYLFYQVLAATFRVIIALGMGTDVGDYGTITPMPILHATMFVALIPAFLVTILILAHLSGSGQWLNRILTYRRIRFVTVLLIVILIFGDLLQYGTWASEPEYTTVKASQQIKEDFGDGIILGGAFAAVLGIENDYPGVKFFMIQLRKPEYQQRVLDSGLTHLAMVSAGIYGDIPENDDELKREAPDLVEHLDLSRTYYVRGYTISIYEIEPN